MNLLPGEKLEDLGIEKLKIIQSDELYRFTSDAVLLANLATVVKGARVIDLGAGSGIIGIIIAAKRDVTEVIGLELQPELANMARRSAEYNNLGKKVRIIEGDIKAAPEILGREIYDLVVVNPPYAPAESGGESEKEHINICKREKKIKLEEIIVNAAKILKFGGRLCMIHKSNRLAEVIALAMQNNLTPKRLICVHPKSDRPADTVIVECKKGAAHGMSVDTLIVYNEDGSMTERAARLYLKE
jgi:tRNA1(Val) A37 N6-methylase TrmN6